MYGFDHHGNMAHLASAPASSYRAQYIVSHAVSFRTTIFLPAGSAIYVPKIQDSLAFKGHSITDLNG